MPLTRLKAGLALVPLATGLILALAQPAAAIFTTPPPFASPLASPTATVGPTISSFTAHDRLTPAGRLTIVETFTLNPGQIRPTEPTIGTTQASPTAVTQSIPITYSDDQGNPLASHFTLATLTRDGRPLALKPTFDATVVKFTFPVPADYLPHTYNLTYILEPVILAAPAGDILKFSATGLGWDVPIEHATIYFDTTGLKPQNITCYTGSEGATTSDCRFTESGSLATITTSSPLQPGDTLQLAAGFPRHSFGNYYNSNLVWVTETIIVLVGLFVILTGGVTLLKRLNRPKSRPVS